MSLVIQFVCNLQGHVSNLVRGLEYLNFEVERANNFDVKQADLEVVEDSIMCNDDVCSFNVKVHQLKSKKSGAVCPGDVLLGKDDTIILKNMLFNKAEIDPEFHVELYAAQLGNKSIYIDLYQGGNEHVAYGAWYKAKVIAGEFKPFVFSPISTDENAWASLKQKMPGEIEMIYRIRAKGKSYRYQVRGIPESEVKSKGFTKPKYQFDWPSTFTFALHCCSNNHCGPYYVCSELVIPKGAVVDTVSIYDGGSVIVEEGGRLNDVHVHYGGSLEICSGAYVSNIFENGGAVEGYPMHSSEFMTTTFQDGKIEKDHFTTIHNNVMMKGINIEGTVHASQGSLSIGIRVCDGGSYTLYGGWHRDIVVEKGGHLYICADAHVCNLTAEKGSVVEIWEGAAIINGTLDGRILYSGKDLKKDQHVIITSFKRRDVEYFNSCLDDLDRKVEVVGEQVEE